MSRILLLEDDPILGKALLAYLQSAGHAVTLVSHPLQAREAEADGQFDLLLLDVNLPDGSGFDFCGEMREKGSRLPIIMLTARSDEDSVVTGFESGANDYIRKPVSNRELLARVQTHLNEPMKRDEQIRFGPILVLIGQRKVLIDGREIDFNRREFDIFSQLIRNPGIVLSREQVIAALNSGDNILDRTIDSHFSHIRSKLKKLNISHVQIRSVYGVGYKLEVLT
ncbi:MAG: response regulator transcription factor [Calothrix sp. SM1_5_4]|nr:response regulator transcription factor [Calothrix sp. SM1_5_4]